MSIFKITSWLRQGVITHLGLQSASLLARHWAKMCLLSVWLLLPIQQAAATTRYDACRIVATADSLDADQILYSDTAALHDAIRVLSRPINRHRHRNTLAAAYYYLGRNLSASNAIDGAADCYIACDRLHPDDPILRGRVNTCMAYICSQQLEYGTALPFYERAAKAFLQSGNEWRYAQSLLSLSANYASLHLFPQADSLWHIARTYQLDGAYEARALEMRGLYFYEQQQYDSALVCYLQASKYPSGAEYRCYAYLKIAQIYENIDASSLAYPYAEYIVEHSSNPCLISNAYYTLINHAEQLGDAALVATLSHQREDASRQRNDLTNAYAIAAAGCQQYLSNPYPNRFRNIIIGCCLLACALLCTAFAIYRRRKTQQLGQTEHQLASLQTQIEGDKRNRQEALVQKRQAVEATIENVSMLFAFDNPIWQDYQALCHTANQNLYNIVFLLKQSYPLDQQDILICLLTLFEAPAKVIAIKIGRSDKSISKLKSITAKTLGTTSPQLRDFLITFMAK